MTQHYGDFPCFFFKMFFWYLDQRQKSSAVAESLNVAEAQGPHHPATLRGGGDEVPAAAAAAGLGPSACHVDRAPGSEDLQHPLGQEMIRWAAGRRHLGWVTWDGWGH